MKDQEKFKRYQLGNIVASKQAARFSRKCNCCANDILIGTDYIKVQRATAKRYEQPVHLHVECFRSAMRMLRNAMEVLVVSNETKPAKEDNISG